MLTSDEQKVVREIAKANPTVTPQQTDALASLLERVLDDEEFAKVPPFADRDALFPNAGPRRAVDALATEARPIPANGGGCIVGSPRSPSNCRN